MAFGLYGKALGEDESENGWISYNKENVKAYDENPLDGFVFSNNGFLNLVFTNGWNLQQKGWQVNIRHFRSCLSQEQMIHALVQRNSMHRQ